MSTYCLTLQYDGTRYNGWQKQGNTSNTIQEKLETLLGRLFDSPVEIAGSGRTDAGVHALGQTASFRVPSVVCRYSPEELLILINRYLPEDIRVLDCRQKAKSTNTALTTAPGRTCFPGALPSTFRSPWIRRPCRRRRPASPAPMTLKASAPTSG